MLLPPTHYLFVLAVASSKGSAESATRTVSKGACVVYTCYCGVGKASWVHTSFTPSRGRDRRCSKWPNSTENILRACCNYGLAGNQSQVRPTFRCWVRWWGWCRRHPVTADKRWVEWCHEFQQVWQLLQVEYNFRQEQLLDCLSHLLPGDCILHQNVPKNMYVLALLSPGCCQTADLLPVTDTLAFSLLSPLTMFPLSLWALVYMHMPQIVWN